MTLVFGRGLRGAWLVAMAAAVAACPADDGGVSATSMTGGGSTSDTPNTPAPPPLTTGAIPTTTAPVPGDDTSGSDGDSSTGADVVTSTDTSGPGASSSSSTSTSTTGGPAGASTDSTGGGSDPSTTSTTDGGMGSSDGGSSGSTGGGPDGNGICMGPDPQLVCNIPAGYTGAGTCDPYAQDCPAGEKCLPWADDGGTQWNATVCGPVQAMPGQLGDPCTAVDNGLGGEDSCDVGLMCWNVTAGVGECIELCGCGPLTPTCPSGGAVCVITNSGALPVCLPSCDPILQDCGPGQLCTATNIGVGSTGGTFICVPDASGPTGGPGDECLFANACDPGNVCIAPASVPGCVSMEGCCAEVCDLDDGDADCTLAGTTCQPLYAPGSEPEDCMLDAGVCAS